MSDRAVESRSLTVRPTYFAAAVALTTAMSCAPMGRPGDSGTAFDPAIPPRASVAFESGWRFPGGRRPDFAPHAMVASSSPIAAEAGAEILREGGNAVDAAVATGFALAVAFPEAGNLGGGGFMVIRMADGRTAALDYREVAPLAATHDMYVGPDGGVTRAGIEGPLASGVPGAVAGMAEALSKWGTMPLSRVMAPAIRLAESGFILDSTFEHSVRTNAKLITRYGGDSLFLPGGTAPPIGSLFRQPALARSLRLIARDGAKAFYEGEIATAIADQMKRQGGLMTREDLARYRPIWRTPIRTSYRGYTFLTMPPASSGGITIGETLNILEALGSVPPFGSASDIHLLAASFQRAFIDRNDNLGDPAFVKIPSQLLEKEYARQLASKISRERAIPTTSIGSGAGEGSETTHISVVDAHGNAVAETTTLNDLYGSGVYVGAAGFFLNDEMDDFTAKPGSPNVYQLIQGEQNAIAPGKRMLSAMSPTIVLDPAGHLLLVIGARGGPRIITSVTQVIRNVIDRRMSLADAMSAPRIHYQALPDSIRYDSAGFSPNTLRELTEMGWAIHPIKYIGASVTAIMRVRGGYEGMDDPRASGRAAGF